MNYEKAGYNVNILPKAVLDWKSPTGAKRVYVLTIMEKKTARMYSWQFDTDLECHAQSKEFFTCLNADYAKEQAASYASSQER